MKAKSARRAPKKKNTNKRMLLIGHEQRVKIALCIAMARQDIVSIENLEKAALPGNSKIVKLSDRPPLPDGVKQNLNSYGLELPVGYTAAISFEEQPPGLCRHLSIATKPGSLPSDAAIKMIAAEFGMHDPDCAWLEEFRPGHFAINLIELDAKSAKKH